MCPPLTRAARASAPAAPRRALCVAAWQTHLTVTAKGYRRLLTASVHPQSLARWLRVPALTEDLAIAPEFASAR